MNEIRFEVDPAELAVEAGLNGSQRAHFVRGWTGEDPENLPVDRQRYTALQAATERKVTRLLRAHHITPDHVDDRPFAYLTPRPLTPLHNLDHDRAEDIRNMLQAPALAFLVCSDKGLLELEAIFAKGEQPTAKRVQAILEVIFSIQRETFSYHTSSERGGTFMAMKAHHGLPAVAFEATQSPNLENTSFGRVVFQHSAQEMYDRALRLHQLNRLQGQSREHIAGLLQAMIADLGV